MTNSITKLENGDFKVNTLEEFDRELKKLRESYQERIDKHIYDLEIGWVDHELPKEPQGLLNFPMLKGKKNG